MTRKSSLHAIAVNWRRPGHELASSAAAAGVGIVVGGAVQAMGRNPDAQGMIMTNMILGIALL